MKRSYTVCYETESHVTINSLQYGELTSFRQMCKGLGYKITKIEYLVNGKVVNIKVFD